MTSPGKEKPQVSDFSMDRLGEANLGVLLCAVTAIEDSQVVPQEDLAENHAWPHAWMECRCS